MEFPLCFLFSGGLVNEIIVHARDVSIHSLSMKSRAELSYYRHSHETFLVGDKVMFFLPEILSIFVSFKLMVNFS